MSQKKAGEKSNQEKEKVRPQILWAPWRMGYILRAKQRGCFLCQAARGKNSDEDYVVFRSNTAFVILNTFPYNNGHLMVVPVRHVADLEALTETEAFELFRLTRLSLKALRSTIRPHGFNVGVNLGACAGAGVKDHLHIHLVPRWEGDTNFMPVLGGTKVIPQSLLELRDTLRKAFPNDWVKLAGLPGKDQRNKGRKHVSG
ncbi:MAG TPA: HIT domain-containing protein [bacterium]|nr:HIT domain-containing protein [bacterium]HOL66444.1 HIT domain-containing protein [bacterium]HPP11481.1 HIT domain-containing protein [bacterium]